MRKPKLLIVGCGDVGLRLAALAQPRWRVLALSSTPERHPLLRAAGVVPLAGNLDQPDTLRRLTALRQHVVMLAPPPQQGDDDPRSRHLLAALRTAMIGGGSAGLPRLVYASTSGVYGDCRGQLIDETRAPRPVNARARRRLAAEQCWRGWGRGGAATVSIVRVPGIYDGGLRSPRQRLLRAVPALCSGEDVYTNHIHADDLARILWRALFRGAPNRVYHASDDSRVKVGDYLDLAAALYRLPAVPRVTLEQARAGALSPAALSFLGESRQLDNQRLKTELGLRLRYPDVASGLASGPG